MKNVTALLFIVFSSVCTSVVYGISGGSFAGIEAFPHAVSVQAYGSHTCGGNIIGEKHILTAAHCMDNGTQANDLTIFSGSSDLLSRDSQIHEVVMIIIHPEYSVKGFLNDIAVLKLRHPMAFSNVRQPILLPTDNMIDSRIPSKLCGWGVAHPNKMVPSQYLKQLEIFPLNTINEDEDPTLLAKMENGLATWGDSGGGLVSRGELIGIYSISRRIIPDVATFTRVHPFKAWILKVSKY